MIALRENEPLATSLGIDVTRYLVLAAVVSAAIAGRGGQPLRALTSGSSIPTSSSSSTR